MSEKCIIIGCEMLKNEIEYACQKTNCTWPIIWIPRKYHNTPEKLKIKLQETIDACQNYDRLIFTFGCCGGGTDGLCSQNTDMTFFRFEDCVHMLLHSSASEESLVQKGVIYLTDGWIKDEQSIVQQYEYTMKKYGAKMCDNIMKMIYGNFHEISVIDTGAYEIQETIEYAKTAAFATNMKMTCCKGTTRILEEVFGYKMATYAITYQAGQVVRQTDFNN